MEKLSFVNPSWFTTAVGDLSIPVAVSSSSDSFSSGSRAAASTISAKIGPKPTISCHVVVDPAKLFVCGRSDGAVVSWKYDDRVLEWKETLLGRHVGSVTGIVLDTLHGSAGIVFTCGSDGAVRVWDPFAPKEPSLQTLSLHQLPINCIDFGSYGSVLVVGSSDGCVSVCKPAVARDMAYYPWFECVQVIDLGRHWITSIVVTESELGSTIYAGNAMGDVSVLERSADGASMSLAPATEPWSQPSIADSTHVLPAASTAYPGSSKSQSRSRSKLPPGAEFNHIRTHARLHRLSIHTLMFLAESHHLCSLSNDCTGKVMDVSTGCGGLFVDGVATTLFSGLTIVLCVNSLLVAALIGLLVTVDNRRNTRFRSMTWNALHQEWYLGDDAGFLTVWSIYRDALVKEQQVSEGPVTGVSQYDNTGTSLHAERLCYSAGNRLSFFDISRSTLFGEVKAHEDAVVGLCTSYVYPTHSLAPQAVPSNSKDARIFSAGTDNFIRCWDAFDMSELFKFVEKVDICSMMYMSVSELLVAGLEDGSMAFWNPDSKSCIRVKEHTDTVTAMAFARHKSRDYLLSTGYDGRVVVWDVTIRRTVQPEAVSSFQASGGPRKVAGSTSSLPTSVPTWNSSLPGEYEILCMVFDGYNADEDQHTFATGGNDQLIKVWSIVNSSLLCTLEGHTGAVTCLAADRSVLYSGSEDGSIRVWNVSDPARGYCIGVVPSAHSSTVRDLCMFPGFESVVITCSFEGDIKFWNCFAFDSTASKRSHLIYSYKNGDQLGRLVCSGNQVIVGSQQGRLFLYPLPSEAIESLAFRSDGAHRVRQSRRGSRETATSALPTEIPVAPETTSVVKPTITADRPPAAPTTAGISRPVVIGTSTEPLRQSSVLSSIGARSISVDVKAGDPEFWKRRDSWSTRARAQPASHSADGHVSFTDSLTDSKGSPTDHGAANPTEPRLGLASSHSVTSSQTGQTFMKRTRRPKGSVVDVDSTILQSSLRLDALRQTRDHMKVPSRPHLTSSGELK